MKFATISRKEPNCVLKFILLMSLLTIINVAAIEDFGSSRFKLSNFVQNLAENSRHRRSPIDRNSNNRAIIHPRINQIYPNNMRRMVSRTLDSSAGSRLPSNLPVSCGNCQKKRMFITIRKPSCKSKRIPVPFCQGLCESWEVRLYFQ